MNSPNKCPECNSPSQYTTHARAGGSHGPYFLPGLGGFFHMASFTVVVCSNCGLTRLYAEPSARTKLPHSSRWRPV